MSNAVTCTPASSSDLRAIAYHEAGHVVVGMKLGLEVLGADIDRDDEGGRGHTQFAPAGAWFQPADGKLTARERDFVERVVTTFMAGFAAEDALGEADPEGSGFDADQAAREWLSYLEPNPRRRPALARRFLARAQSELAAPAAWRAVERVASTLLGERRLDGARARAVAGSSAWLRSGMPGHAGRRHSSNTTAVPSSPDVRSVSSDVQS